MAHFVSMTPNFTLMEGLIPVVIQDFITSEVLMLGYMNEEAWHLTLSSMKVHYYSRKKKRVWLKGEQSKHYQFVKEVKLNCDNTTLLIKVDQVGGACDLGLKSCFDKELIDGEFVYCGTKVFDPQIAYGEKYSDEIVLGISSGSLESMTLKLFELAGYELDRFSNRSYHPRLLNEPSIKILMTRAQEIPGLLDNGLLDVAITGLDVIQESGVSVRDICDLGFNKLGRGTVFIALAVPEDMGIYTLGELQGTKIATSYPNIVKKFFEDKGIDVSVVFSYGATEGKVPLIADAVVDLAETGYTLQANHLKPIAKVFESTVHMFARNESWAYTWKRRRIETIASRLYTASNSLPSNPKNLLSFPILK